ncbi:hypothetical protein KDH_22750 [Dictyobacter sp. S3.2.2.5]|uniref:Uncharacterized protein n=1 Tax=Dictyobacter halimunensis TaxID=3026934 RepID=A0ABQ6FRM8_9CHLR|nr:hypothetical protein KDH_22750 [Dictyobacter sp. S3.2.2.5]
MENISPHVVPGKERSLKGSCAERSPRGTTFPIVDAMGSGIVGVRGPPLLALAARSTVEGRPYDYVRF